MTAQQEPHSHWSGYVAELRNPISGGHTIILDCKLAESQWAPLVDNYASEGGRYQVVCNAHDCLQHTTSMAKARLLMENATAFCAECRKAQEGGAA